MLICYYLSEQNIVKSDCGNVLLDTSIVWERSHVKHKFFALQSELAAQLVIPPSVALVLPVLLVICGLTLLLVVRAVTIPLLNQTLRLSED